MNKMKEIENIIFKHWVIQIIGMAYTRPCPEQNKGALINELLGQFRFSVSHPF